MKSVFIIYFTIFISFSVFCDPYDDFIDLMKKGDDFHRDAYKKYEAKYLEQSLDLYNKALDCYFEADKILKLYKDDYYEYFGELYPLYAYNKYDMCSKQISKIKDKLKNKNIENSEMIKNLIYVTSETQFKELTSNKLVFSDFYADWANPCKEFAPIFKEISKSFPSYTFLKINTDYKEFESLTEKFQIEFIPYIVALNDGKVVQQFNGNRTISDFKEWCGNQINNFLTNYSDKNTSQIFKSYNPTPPHGFVVEGEYIIFLFNPKDYPVFDKIHTVTVAGEFNGWDSHSSKSALFLDKDSIWKLKILKSEIIDGTSFKFVINEADWMQPDPDKISSKYLADDGFGGFAFVCDY